MTRGALGAYMLLPQLLEDLDLLKSLEAEASLDPNVLSGTPCSPGEVEGVVRVVTSIDQTKARSFVSVHTIRRVITFSSPEH